MNQWTNEAHQVWERFSETARARFSTGDVDPNEVLDDLRRHVEAELAAQNLTVVTADDLRKVLSKLDLSADNSPPACAPAQNNAPEPKSKSAFQTILSGGAIFYIVTFGILLPIAAMTFELFTGICASAFFDPLPTVWHAIIFGLIPASNLIGLTTIAYRSKRATAWLPFANALAIGIAVFYTIWFVPILPVSAMATLFIGIGLCGLAPLLSLFACLMVRRRLRLLAVETTSQTPRLWPGVTAGIGVLILLAVPTLLSIIGLNMAVSENSSTQTKGLSLLRAFGSKNYLLELCYNNRDREFFGIDLTGTADISTDQVRGIYYRVTGKSFSAQRPKTQFLRGRTDWLDDWDFEQAGDIVGGRLRNLSLVSSQMDANLQGDAAVGYLEWIMVFQNDHKWTQREARCQIQLPPGGVVSRLTLWIDGQECEAAFGGRSQTKGAYKSVVERRRDPVLVTTKGPDQVLVQCFPVEPNGGKMKIRLGVSFPLDLLTKEQALLQLPYINECNFGIPESTQHQLWVEADGPMTAALNLTKEQLPDQNRYALRGPLTNAQLEHQLAAVHIQRNADITKVWAKNDTSGVSVLQQLQNHKDSSLIDKAVIVVDTSAAMKSSLDDIREAISSFNPNFPLHIITADDSPRFITLASELSKGMFSGGKDNLPTLIKAWDMAAESDNAAVIWIHSAQPHLFDAVEALMQRYMRRPDGPALFHIQTAPGPNMIIEALDGIIRVQAVARSADLKADLTRLFDKLNGTLPTYHFMREVLTAETDAAAKQASSHIVRLWAKEQVDTLRARRGGEEQAREIAVRHQLVTPVSGAVVLENKAQYDQHGLEPVAPETVPTIPEPATILLFGLGALVLTRRKYKGPARRT